MATLLIIAAAPCGRIPTPDTGPEAAAGPLTAAAAAAEEAAVVADVAEPAATEAEEEDDATLPTSDASGTPPIDGLEGIRPPGLVGSCGATIGWRIPVCFLSISNSVFSC